jgi:hypothetical protein
MEVKAKVMVSLPDDLLADWTGPCEFVGLLAVAFWLKRLGASFSAVIPRPCTPRSGEWRLGPYGTACRRLRMSKRSERSAISATAARDESVARQLGARQVVQHT